MKKDGRICEKLKRAEKGGLSVTVRDCREKKNRIRGETLEGKKGIVVIAEERDCRMGEYASTRKKTKEKKEFVN